MQLVGLVLKFLAAVWSVLKALFSSVPAAAPAPVPAPIPSPGPTTDSGPAPAPGPVIDSQPEASGGAYFGLLASGPNGGITNAATVALEKLLNKNIAVKMVGGGDNMDLAAVDRELGIIESDFQAFQAIPMLHINAHNRTLSEIASNTIHPNDRRRNYDIAPDTFYRHWAQGLKAYGRPVLLRIFSEMNWTGSGNTGQASYRISRDSRDIDTGEVQTPELLISAWRHIHDIFAAEGARNVRFMWIQIPHYSGCFVTTPYDVLYPGDAYVDWVGWDVYNFNKRGWFSFSTLVDADYVKMQSIAPGKPMIIPEFNTAPGAPGQRAVWYHDMLSSLPSRYPKIKAISFFNVASGNLRPIQDEPDAVEAFRNAIASEYFLSSAAGFV